MELQKTIWERQKNERSKAFYMFTLYRDMGPLRSFSKVVAKHKEDEGNNISTHQLERYSVNHSWVQRAQAYDDYKDELICKEQEEAIKKMVRRHAEKSMELQNDVLAIKDDSEIKTLKPTQKAWLLNTTVNSYEKMALLERLSRGEPTEHIEEKHTGIDDLALKLQAGREKARKKKKTGN